MANYNIRLLNILDTINGIKVFGQSESFIFKYLKKEYIISVHHFKPIVNTIMNITEKIMLRPNKVILWNELQIFDCPDKKYFLNTKVIKSYRTRFLKKDATVGMYINNKKETFVCVDYEIIHNTLIQKNIYLKILLSDKNTSNKLNDDINIIDKFKGLSGSPVFDKNDNFIGVFCKIKTDNDKIYGYALPSIYLIKSLEKSDNENLYELDIQDLNNLKIGKYEVQNNNDKHTIYYSPINYKIPLEIFYSLEGDSNKNLICKELSTDTPKEYCFVKYTNFDISTKIIKKDKDYKLNTGLIMYLVSNGRYSEYNLIISSLKNQKILNDIWIRFDDKNTISII